MESKKDRSIAYSMGKKIDEMLIKLGLPPAKWVTRTGYTITIGVKPLWVSDKKNK